MLFMCEHLKHELTHNCFSFCHDMRAAVGIWHRSRDKQKRQHPSPPPHLPHSLRPEVAKICETHLPAVLWQALEVRNRKKSAEFRFSFRDPETPRKLARPPKTGKMTIEGKGCSAGS